MTTPDFIPVLSEGGHSSPENGACVMEMVSYMSGDKWTDMPKCTNKIIAKTAQRVNDTLSDPDRHLIMSQFDRLFNTNEVSYDEMNIGVIEYVRGKVSNMQHSIVREIIEGYLRIDMPVGALAHYITEIGRDNPNELVQVLSDVLDIYDHLSGRTEVTTQDITKLKEIQNV